MKRVVVLMSAYKTPTTKNVTFFEHEPSPLSQSNYTNTEHFGSQTPASKFQPLTQLSYAIGKKNSSRGLSVQD